MYRCFKVKLMLLSISNPVQMNLLMVSSTLATVSNSNWSYFTWPNLKPYPFLPIVYPNLPKFCSIRKSFVLLFKDLVRLFACYNDGIINLLQKYFEMRKGQCKDGLEIYKRYLVRMEKIQAFFKVAENVSQTRFNTSSDTVNSQR